PTDLADARPGLSYREEGFDLTLVERPRPPDGPPVLFLRLLRDRRGGLPGALPVLLHIRDKVADRLFPLLRVVPEPEEIVIHAINRIFIVQHFEGCKPGIHISGKPGEIIDDDVGAV